jgi:hypothetical protein
MATLAPSFERDAQAGLTGDVEIWWIRQRSGGGRSVLLTSAKWLSSMANASGKRMKRRLDFEAFHSAQIARQINVSRDGKLGLQIHITEVSAAQGIPGNTFEVSGHKTTRAFTDEVR